MLLVETPKCLDFLLYNPGANPKGCEGVCITTRFCELLWIIL